MPSHTTATGLVPFDEAVTRYEPLIGLETHVELGTTTKLFCGSPATFGGEPNTQVCPVCLGLPGSLPVPSRAAIEYTIKIGLALNCTIADWCRFARKNYFYPDMPKNFQISQYDEPLCTDGWLDVTLDGPETGGNGLGTRPRRFRVGIERVHLEEDTGKSLHVGGATGRIHGADYSLVDYNRAGIPLVEVVTKPARCAATSTRHWRRVAPANGESAQRPRTSTRSGRSSVPCGRRSSGRPRCWTPATGWCRRPGTSTRIPARAPRAGARKRRRTTGISPSPTWCRSRRRRSGWSSCGRSCRSCRQPAGPACRPSGGSPTWT